MPAFPDRALALVLLLAALLLAGRGWLADHPQHNPYAPLDLSHPRGWATAGKLDALRGDPAACQAVLAASGVAFAPLEPAGEGECRRDDRLRLTGPLLAPGAPEMTCATAAGLLLWLRHDLQPAAQARFDQEIATIEQLGTYSCRRLYGASEGAWSEHATGNAIDVAGFVLADGQRISLLRDWDGDGAEAAFLRDARDGACDSFGTVLSPDYNAAHADHFHLDQGRSPRFPVCR